jgi:hypothetical protein
MDIRKPGLTLTRMVVAVVGAPVVGVGTWAILTTIPIPDVAHLALAAAAGLCVVLFVQMERRKTREMAAERWEFHTTSISASNSCGRSMPSTMPRSTPLTRRSPTMQGPYRRKIKSQTWHWCKNCPEWPTGNFETRPARPTSGKLCAECQVKEAAGKSLGERWRLKAMRRHKMTATNWTDG